MTEEIKQATLRWVGDLRFEGTAPGTGTMTIDANNVAAPGPLPTLLLAAAACSASDVVSMIEKMRMGLKSLTVYASGTRREAEPRRLVGIHFIYAVHGEGLDEAKVRRAVALALDKYCSVVHSLAGDLAITHDVVLS
jgi:putative redox protein